MRDECYGRYTLQVLRLLVSAFQIIFMKSIPLSEKRVWILPVTWQYKLTSYHQLISPFVTFQVIFKLCQDLCVNSLLGILGSTSLSLAKASLSQLEKGAEDPSPCPLPSGERIQAASGIHRTDAWHPKDGCLHIWLNFVELSESFAFAA